MDGGQKGLNRNATSAIERKRLKELEQVGRHRLFLREAYIQGRISEIFRDHHNILPHEIKRCLFLGRKAMTNLDSILKSRDIIWPTKVYLIKAMVFPVVMYGYESWTIKKAEH